MLRIALQLCLFLVLAAPGLAEDWVATRLRGTAEQMVRGQWIPLERGSIVLDGHQVRTGPDGRVDLTRGAEVIQLDPGTQIELHEGAGKFTSVEMVAGAIVANVERRNVQHFSVQTPYLAAVVKGTIFRVAVGGGAASVEVDRGTVQVQDTLNDLVTDIVRGQEAHVSRSQPLEVSGSGSVAVFTFGGERVVNGTSDVPADDRGRPADAGNGSGQGNANAGGNGNGQGNASGNGGNGNAGGNGNNAGGHGNGHGNAGGNGDNAGGHGNGNAGGHGNGHGNSGAGGNAGNNGNGNGNGNAGGGGNGNGNAGGNADHHGNGNGGQGQGNDNGKK